MIIKAIYHMGEAVLNSPNRAIALYSLCSMSMLSAAFATSISYLYNRGVKRGWLLLGLAFYALSPVNGIYSVTMWKDIPFAVAVLFYMILLCKLLDHLKRGKNQIGYWIAFVVCSFFVCFLRSNGLYVFFFMIPILLVTFRRQYRSVLISIAAVIVMIAIYKGPVFRYFDVAEPDMIESLSIPAQQMAAVICYGGYIEDKDLQMLEAIVDIDKVPEAYGGSVGCSDAVKNLVRETDNQQFLADHGREFMSIWLRTGIRNPYYYFKAYVDETKGFWCHDGTLYMGVWATYLFEALNGVGIYRQCKMPDSMADMIPNMLAWYRIHFQKYYSCAFFIYIVLFCIIESCRQKNEKWPAIMPLLGIWLTLLIATPICSDIRYIYAVYTAVPFTLSLVLIAGEDRDAAVIQKSG